MLVRLLTLDLQGNSFDVLPKFSTRMQVSENSLFFVSNKNSGRQTSGNFFKAFAASSKFPSSGDYSVVEPPVPIPNTAVKHHSANGSASIGCARVGRCQFFPGK